MSKKKLLAQLPKRTRDRIARIMEQGGGDLSLEEFLAKRWDYRSYWSSPKRSDEENAKEIDVQRANVRELFPHFDDEQVELYMSFHVLRIGLRERSIARRIVLEDPGELARGLALDGRLYRLLRGLRDGYPSEVLIDQCAICRLDFAAECVDGRRAGHDAVMMSARDAIEIGIVAMLQRNRQALEVVAANPTQKYDAKWIEGLYTALVGVARNQPSLVDDGLSLYLTAIKNMRLKDELEDAINLTAQGLHRLCEWMDPELVSKFDVDQGRPWDAPFHHWCEEHPDPLKEIDLTSISPVLHDAVILNNCPDWIRGEPGQTWEIVLTGMGDQKTSSRGMAELRKQLIGMLEDGPVVTHWNLSRQNAERRCSEMAEVGGQTEIRPGRGTDYRLFSVIRNKVTEWKPGP